MTNVIDISSWQYVNGHTVDFAAVKGAGILGVIIKATQGVSYVNPDFQSGVAAAQAAGLLVGAYHFAEPSQSSAEDQAAYFNDQVMGHTLALGTWLDLEVTGGVAMFQVSQWAETFVNMVTTGPTPCGLYTDRSMYESMTNGATFARLWAALPAGGVFFGAPLIVQTGQGDIPGVVGAVDLDTLTSLRGINAPGGAPTPGVGSGPAVPTEPEIRAGSTGQAVKDLQNALTGWGDSLAIDGIFGPLTEAAVKAFQTSQGIAVDGIVGPITWGKLRG